jgi:hypothetical protein
LEDDYPTRKFSIDLASTDHVFHWIGIFHNLGSSKQDIVKVVFGTSLIEVMKVGADPNGSLFFVDRYGV